MKNIYYIGRFRFDSYAEYKKGVEDVKKIKYISDEVDINEPGVAMRLYTLIRKEKIKFQSMIGEDYLLYLSDLVADDYKDLANGNEVYLAELGSVRSPRKTAGILCIAVAVLCFAYFFGSEYLSYQKTRQIKELQESRDISRAAQYIADAINGSVADEVQEESELDRVVDDGYAAQPEVQEEKGEVQLAILPDLTEYYEKNQDLVGWITIPGTDINYPVLQSKETADFYLKRDFEKKDSAHGSIYMDSRNDFMDRDTNLIIYGHNMKDGTMFGGINKYQDEDYWKEHKKIKFQTLYEREEYDIIAVCLGKVFFQDEVAFRYYDFINAEDEASFIKFKENIEKMKIIGDDLDISLEDKLLTLSTCNKYMEDGRMFLLAKRTDDSAAEE